MSDDTERPGRRRPRVGRTGARFPKSVEFDDPPADAPPEAGEPTSDVPDAGELVGRTGARFDSRARRKRRSLARAAEQDAVVSPQAPPVRPEQTERTDVAADDDTGPIVVPLDPAFDPDDRVWVRPYVRTRGRTRTRAVLAVETLVSLPGSHPVVVDAEHRAIADVCDGPRSVAEVAARLGVPLGVARVLIDDMATAGLLRVHAASIARAGPPDAALMQRVLDGLHRL